VARREWRWAGCTRPPVSPSSQHICKRGLGGLEWMRGAIAAATEGTGDNELAYFLVLNSHTVLVAAFYVPPKRSEELSVEEWCATATVGGARWVGGGGS